MFSGGIPRHYWILGGLLLMLVGFQFRVVESYVLTTSATNTLAEWFGPPEGTPERALQKLAAQATLARKVITPPRWLGLCLISLGVIAVAKGLLDGVGR